MSCPDPITRVASLTIDRLRGFSHAQEVDLGADVVLLTGGNGFGKSSLMDVLGLFIDGGVDPRVGAAWRHGGFSAGSVRGYFLRGDIPDNWQVRIEGPPQRPVIVHPGAGGLDPRLAALASIWGEGFELEKWRKDKKAEHWLAPLLRPEVGQGPDQLSTVLAQARRRLAEAGERWPLPSVEAQETIVAARKQAVDEVAEAWAKATVLLPPECAPIKLTMRGGKVSDAAWNQFVSRANALSRRAGLTVSPVDSRTRRETVLSFVATAIEAWSRASQPTPTDAAMPTRDLAQRAAKLGLAAQVGWLPDPSWAQRFESVPLVPASEDAAAWLSARQAERAVALTRLSDRRAALHRATEACSGRGRPGLADLFEQLARWTPPDLPAGFEPAPPGEVLAWLAQARTWRRESDGMSLSEAVRRWQQALEEELGRVEEQFRVRSALQERDHLAADLGERLRSAAKVEAPALQGGTLPLLDCLRGAGLLTSEGPSPPAPVNHLDVFASRIRRWEAVERRAEGRAAALRSAPGAQAARSQLAAAAKVIDRVEGLAMDALALPVVELQRLSAVLNDVLGEFRVVSGLELAFNSNWEMEIVTQSSGEQRLRFDSLSTGQRALVGIAQMLAMNLLLEPRLPHRLVLLDDFTTSLDLAQLPAAAHLVRRLAYGGPNGGRPLRQVVLSSHHEDLTARLFELLRPPPGRTLRVVRFVDWTPEEGPTMEQYEVLPQLPSGTDESDATTFRSLAREGLNSLADRYRPGAGRRSALPRSN